MNIRTTTFVAGLLLLLAPIACAASEEQEVASQAGKVTRVTLYRGQALVTRSIPFGGVAGSRELIITDLPSNIVDGSLFAEAPDKVEVRAVRLRQRAVGEEPREEVRKMDEQILAINESIQLNQKKQELTVRKLEYLDQMANFVAPTAKVELAQGVLNAETLEKLTQYSFEQRAKIAEEQISLMTEQRQLNEQLELLQRQKAELTNGSQKTVNEAVLFLEKQGDGEQSIELSYLVNGCGWSPSYTIRAGDDPDQVEVEYNAIIQQMTGEDWSGVKLTLSTASPALSAAGPSLAPFYVSLTSGGENEPVQIADGIAATGQISQQYRTSKMAQSEAQMQLGNVVAFKDKTRLNWAMNRSACDIQGLELSCPSDLITTIITESDVTEGPSLSYSLPNNVSLPSRSDQQMVRILRSGLASSFYHVATPVLSTYVFREAEILNSSTFDLLGGPVAVYVEGRFVGRAEIPTVAQGESFIVGLGADAQLRTRRELVEKTDGIQGGNKEMRMRYRMTVENFKSQPVQVRLFDRLPHSSRASDVRVTLDAPELPLSDDPVYVRSERPKGILRWDIEAPANATGEDSEEVVYGFKIDFDRNFALTTLADQPTLLQEFEQLERARMKR
jgi:hypothetical protein